MRTLTDHIVNPTNDKLIIEVIDEPGSGGASHRYDITGFDTSKNSAKAKDGYTAEFGRMVVIFQNGTIPENGVNGITQEALLAIVVDRLKSFQAGPYACRENALALTHIQEAQNWLDRRTRERMQRGVEGTMVK